MGGSNSNFFAKVADVDPVAQALHLPGSGAAQKGRLDRANAANSTGPYTGVAPTLAGANAGYVPGGPGANTDWKPFNLGNVGGGFFSRAAATSGAVTPGVNPTQFAGPTYGSSQPSSPQSTGPSYTGFGGGPAVNPYVAASQQTMKNPQPWSSTGGGGKVGGGVNGI